MNRTNAGVGQGSTDLTGAIDKPRQPRGAGDEQNGDTVIAETWAVCVNEWYGAEYHERIVGPFTTEEEAEMWALACPEPTSVFDLMPPEEWRPTVPKPGPKPPPPANTQSGWHGG